MNKLFFLTLVSLFHCCHAYEVKEISGSYQFGSDISRIEGCRNAIQSAKANALELYSAEFILSALYFQIVLVGTSQSVTQSVIAQLQPCLFVLFILESLDITSSRSD